VKLHRIALVLAIAVAQLVALSGEAQPAVPDRSEALPRDYELADQQIQAVWKQFCANLRSGNWAGAVQHVTPSSQELYRETFKALGDGIRRLPDGWTKPELLRLSADELAEYLVTETIDGESQIHFVVFVRSSEGVWLIEQL
jgi:hypothetical protein